MLEGVRKRCWRVCRRDIGLGEEEMMEGVWKRYWIG